MKKLLCLILLPVLAASCSALRQAGTSDANPGDEMVNLGYGSYRRNSVSEAVSTVKVGDNIKGYTNIYDFIKGRVPGLEVIGTSFRIRGVNSINSSTDALVLVDGIETPDLSFLNPEEVADVSVLKDASAAIYGARGGNGVILITTKGAKSVK